MGLLDERLVVEIPQKNNFRKLEAKANKILKHKKTRRGKRKKHKRKIPNMSYKMYMGSAYWKKRKLLFWQKFGKTCSICQRKEGVTLHHKRYDVKYGDEPDDSLVALCPFHHHEFHENHDLKTNMVKDTDIYVHTMKQVRESNIDNLNWI